MANVFISYRRSDVPAQAGRVADALRRHACAPQVFHDTADMRPGDLWRERIDAALAQCDAMVVVIGPGWLTPAPGVRQPRLFDADDVVAYELAAGLAAAKARRVRIVPLRVSGAVLPAKVQLPEALAPLLSFSALEIRDDAFERDMRALEAGILPAGRKRTLWWGGAVAAVLVAAVVGWQLKGKPARPVEASGAVVAPASAAAGVDLDVDLAFVPNKAMEQLGLPATSMQLVPEKPKRRGALRLDRRAGDTGVPLHFVHEKLALPRAGETFVGLLARSLDGAVQVTAETVDVIQTQVCFDITAAPPPADGKLRLACREGQRCVPEGSGGIAVPCGSAPLRTTALPARGWRFGDLLRSAQAQSVGVAPSGGAGPGMGAGPSAGPSAGASATTTRPAPGDWIVPPLAALHARRSTPQAVAFSEVTLTLGLPASAPAADEVTYEIRVNGHRLWVNGLPAWTRAAPYKPGEPCRVAFGLENLNSAGRHAGREKVQVRVLLLRDKQLVFEDSVAFDFLALRDQPEQAATSTAGQPVKWQASYLPAPADRYQILLHGGGEADTLAARDKLQAARVPAEAAVAATGVPLVGVVRPPTDTNRSWGMLVGVAQPSGQVRFSYDAARAKALCAWMADDAQARRFKRHGFGEPKNFRVREIATEANDATTRKPLVRCSAFGKA